MLKSVRSVVETIVKSAPFGIATCSYICFFTSHLDHYLTACKESRVPGLVDLAIRLVIFVLNLPNVLFLGKSNYRRIVTNPANQKGFWGKLK